MADKSLELGVKPHLKPHPDVKHSQLNDESYDFTTSQADDQEDQSIETNQTTVNIIDSSE